MLLSVVVVVVVVVVCLMIVHEHAMLYLPINPGMFDLLYIGDGTRARCEGN
jgi:hypothetical protein